MKKTLSLLICLFGFLGAAYGQMASTKVVHLEMPKVQFNGNGIDAVKPKLLKVPHLNVAPISARDFDQSKIAQNMPWQQTIQGHIGPTQPDVHCGVWCILSMADYAASVTADIESQLHCQKFGCIETGIAKNSKRQLSVPTAIGIDAGLATLPVIMRLGFTHKKIDARIYEAMLHGIAGAHWYAVSHNMNLANELKNRR